MYKELEKELLQDMVELNDMLIQNERNEYSNKTKDFVFYSLQERIRRVQRARHYLMIKLKKD